MPALFIGGANSFIGKADSFVGGFAAAAGDVNVTLTGIALSTSQGALSYAFSKTVETQILSLSQGSLSYLFSQALVGNLINSSQGNLTLTNNLTLTGLGLSSSQGALVYGLSKTLDSQLLQLSQGVLTATIGGNVNVTLTGIGMGLSQGGLTATTTFQQDLGGLGKQLRKRALKQIEAPEGLSEIDAEIRQLLIIASEKTALSLKGERKLLLPPLAIQAKVIGEVTNQINPLTTIQIQALLALMIEMM